jgi:hypothetical protein
VTVAQPPAKRGVGNPNLREAGLKGNATRRRQGTESRVRAVIERAGELTPEQVQRLRQLLPPVPEADAV